jgi:hypothetical protein
VGNLALFAGGIDSSATQLMVDIYNTSSGTWTTGDYLLQARYYLVATSVGTWPSLLVAMLVVMC